MDFQDKKSRLLDAMKQCRETPLTQVHFAWALPASANAAPQPFFRITFPLTDSIKIKAAFDGKIETRDVHPTEAIFFRSFSWDKVISSPGESLSIVYRPDFIRLVLDLNTIAHNPHSLSSAGLHTIQVLDALAQEKKSDQQLSCDAVKFLLDTTRRDFALPIEDTSHAFDTFLEIKHFVSEHYAEFVNRDSVAEHFSMSSGYISQLFKRYSNSSFNYYLNQLKLNKAEHLLLNTSYPLSKIAEQCGFSCDARLIKTFRKHYGTSPGRFRLSKKHRTNLTNNNQFL